MRWHRAVSIRMCRNARLNPFFAAILTFALVGGGCSSSRIATSGGRLRVMTWNVHHGEGIDKKVDIERIAKLILSEKPDVVALQEIDRGVERSGKIDIITRLADLTDMTYAFGMTTDFQGGEYGNAFLTRFPILEERNLKYSLIRPGEQRGLLQLILDFRGEEIVVANTHLDQSDDAGRASSVGELRSTLRAYSPRPIVVCGDFSDLPESQVIADLRKDFEDSFGLVGRGEGFTYPSNAPNRRTDYILTLKNAKPDSATAAVHLQAMSARVLQSSASDHLPLLVEFELRTER